MKHKRFKGTKGTKIIIYKWIVAQIQEKRPDLAKRETNYGTDYGIKDMDGLKMDFKPELEGPYVR
jgi:hypothetical protein